MDKSVDPSHHGDQHQHDDDVKDELFISLSHGASHSSKHVKSCERKKRY
jgi:hypothetical protein